MSIIINQFQIDGLSHNTSERSHNLGLTSEFILWFHYLCSQCYAAQHSFVPILSLRRDSPSKIVPDFLCATL